jgi:uncharacterized repeat protein (TIGR04076 family)
MNKTLKRREFCRALSGAALGGLSLPLLAEKAFGKMAAAKEAGQASKQRLIRGEGKMGKKIRAVEAKVISVKGTCGLGHKVGDVIKFTEQGVDGKICIHALYSMLPAVFAMMFEARFPWLSDPDKKTHPCTDAANPVVFEISRVREA